MIYIYYLIITDFYLILIHLVFFLILGQFLFYIRIYASMILVFLLSFSVFYWGFIFNRFNHEIFIYVDTHFKINIAHFFPLFVFFCVFSVIFICSLN